MGIDDTRECMKAGVLTDQAADALLTALQRMHARDREQITAGTLKASALHLIPAEKARSATVRWTRATTVRFKG